MTEPFWIALIAGLPPTIAALGAIVVGLHNSKKADDIHHIVDGNLSKVQEDLKKSLERIDALETYIREVIKKRKADHA
jgi:hypothetical protein